MTRLALLWLAAFGLRLTLLAVPPVLPLIHRDLRLSESAVAILANLPVLLLAGSSIFGSLLVARWGARTALIAGLAEIALSSALRGIGHTAVALFGFTFLMGLGIAIIQPAFPALSRTWFPARIPLATSVWANGLLVGEALSASLTVPLVLPLTGGSWAASFAVWGAFVGLIALTVALVARDRSAARPVPGTRWFPNFRDPQQWQLGILQASASVAYFGANAFLPDYLQATGQGHAIGSALAVLNIGQLPASLALAVVPIRQIARVRTALGLAAGLIASLALVLAGGGWAVAGAGLTGFCAALILVLSFAVPALCAGPGDVARLSAGMYTIGYTSAFAVSLVVGALWDATGAALAALLPLALAAVVIILLGPRIRRLVPHEP